MVYRLIEVKEFADYRAIADVFGYGAEKIRSEVLKRICGRKEKVCYLFSLANSPIGMS